MLYILQGLRLGGVVLGKHCECLAAIVIVHSIIARGLKGNE